MHGTQQSTLAVCFNATVKAPALGLACTLAYPRICGRAVFGGAVRTAGS